MDVFEYSKEAGCLFTGWAPKPPWARKWHYFVDSRSLCGCGEHFRRNDLKPYKPDDEECCKICLKKYNKIMKKPED
jgi:hypothetical protein